MPVSSPPIPSDSRSSDSDGGDRLASARARPSTSTSNLDVINSLIKGQMKGLLGDLMEQMRREFRPSASRASPDDQPAGPSGSGSGQGREANQGRGPGDAELAVAQGSLGGPSSSGTRDPPARRDAVESSGGGPATHRSRFPALRCR